MRPDRIFPSARRTAAAGAVLGILLATPSHGQSSRYTSLAEGDCRNHATSILETYSPREVEECMAPEGVRLLLVFEGERSSLVIIQNGRRLMRTRTATFNNRRIGYFPNVSRNTPAEWRYGRDGQPRALIFRVRSQSRVDSATNISQFLIVRLDKKGTCVVGPVATNEKARELADGPATCVEAC